MYIHKLCIPVCSNLCMNFFYVCTYIVYVFRYAPMEHMSYEDDINISRFDISIQTNLVFTSEHGESLHSAKSFAL